ncbi:matrixin family metalloprotease [Candidatus Woesearchaeota archaeon]|nr:matrixin family metalloprotease [Candidatus Woesearchaeota archaeon]
MKIRYVLLSLVLIILVTSIATASMIIPANDNAKENSNAPENSPVIDENWDLERVDFIHYVKPPNVGKGGKTNTCYKLMGVKWNSLPVSYIINPSNTQGLSENFITSAVSTSTETWDASTSSELFNNIYAINYSATYGIQDFKNSIDFNDYPDNNVIAVTSVWYTRVGKQIVEFDQRYNTRFSWGDATVDPSKMDLQNIAVHELGHAVGLDDIYTTTCSSVTMYGYSTEGETSKRTLEQPDIAGLQAIYGI